MEWSILFGFIWSIMSVTLTGKYICCEIPRYRFFLFSIPWNTEISFLFFSLFLYRENTETVPSWKIQYRNRTVLENPIPWHPYSAASLRRSYFDVKLQLTQSTPHWLSKTVFLNLFYARAHFSYTVQYKTVCVLV